MSVAAAPLSAAGNPYCFGLCTWDWNRGAVLASIQSPGCNSYNLSLVNAGGHCIEKEIELRITYTRL